jgi:hypothetical protein
MKSRWLAIRDSKQRFTVPRVLFRSVTRAMISRGQRVTFYRDPVKSQIRRLKRARRAADRWEATKPGQRGEPLPKEYL